VDWDRPIGERVDTEHSKTGQERGRRERIPESIGGRAEKGKLTRSTSFFLPLEFPLPFGLPTLSPLFDPTPTPAPCLSPCPSLSLSFAFSGLAPVSLALAFALTSFALAGKSTIPSTSLGSRLISRARYSASWNELSIDCRFGGGIVEELEVVDEVGEVVVDCYMTR
jgi:hypothetical protein